MAGRAPPGARGTPGAPGAPGTRGTPGVAPRPAAAPPSLPPRPSNSCLHVGHPEEPPLRRAQLPSLTPCPPRPPRRGARSSRGVRGVAGFRWGRSSCRSPRSFCCSTSTPPSFSALWVLRTILVYVVIAFFITLLLTPATRFLRRTGPVATAGATLLVFLLGVLVLGGLVYLFAEPLVTAAIHFGEAGATPRSARPRRDTARSGAWSTACTCRSTSRRIRPSSPRRSPRC